jgi:multidrug efflux pump subunit AcrB
MIHSESNNEQNNNQTGPIAFMANNPIAANLLMIILIGGGIWMMYNMQKEVFPQYQLDIVEVSVAYPGAAPAEV